MTRNLIYLYPIEYIVTMVCNNFLYNKQRLVRETIFYFLNTNLREYPQSTYVINSQLKERQEHRIK